jgi:hypothetical protein
MNLYTPTLLVLLSASSAALAVTIDNDIASGSLGHFSADVGSGGYVDDAYVTAELSASGGLTTDQVIYDYLTFIDIGSSVFELDDSNITNSASLTGDDEVTSAGSFTGSGGNQINWTAVSWIPDGSATMATRYTFTAASGTLGNLVLQQYLDEDVNNSTSNDVLVATGSPDARNLQLFTIDDAEVYGISHSGAFSPSQGLVNADFLGWAADEYSDLRSAIRNQTATVSRSGIINYDSLPAYTHPVLGQAYGPEDVTSTLAWKAVEAATKAVIITTLGGVPTASSINTGDTITVTYVKGNEQVGSEHWEDVMLWNYGQSSWDVYETRWHSLNLPYELTELDPSSNYWLGSWNYTTNQWDVSVYIYTYNYLK